MHQQRHGRRQIEIGRVCQFSKFSISISGPNWQRGNIKLDPGLKWAESHRLSSRQIWPAWNCILSSPYLFPTTWLQDASVREQCCIMLPYMLPYATFASPVLPQSVHCYSCSIHAPVGVHMLRRPTWQLASPGTWVADAAAAGSSDPKWSNVE